MLPLVHSPGRSRPIYDTDQLRATYTLLAPFYDALVPFISSTARTLALSWIQVRDGERVLDVGTGTGRALKRLAVANPTGWTEGLDLTPALLTRARRRMAGCDHDRHRVRQGHATALPYPDDAFDAVFSSYLLDVLPPSQRLSALLEMRRVVRPPGRLVLVTLAPPQHWIESVWTDLGTLVPIVLGGARPLDLPSLLRKGGFDVHAYTTCIQAGLRSGVAFATP